MHRTAWSTGIPNTVRTLKTRRSRKYDPGPDMGKALFVNYRGSPLYVIVIRRALVKGQARPKDPLYVVAPILPNGTIGSMLAGLVSISAETLKTATAFGRGHEVQNT